jgi:hypothetical protein
VKYSNMSSSLIKQVDAVHLMVKMCVLFVSSSKTLIAKVSCCGIAVPLVRATIGLEAEVSRKYKICRKSQLTPETDRMSKVNIFLINN